MRRLTVLCRKLNQRRGAQILFCVSSGGRGRYDVHFWVSGCSPFGSPCVKFSTVHECEQFLLKQFRKVG